MRKPFQKIPLLLFPHSLARICSWKMSTRGPTFAWVCLEKTKQKRRKERETETSNQEGKLLSTLSLPSGLVKVSVWRWASWLMVVVVVVSEETGQPKRAKLTEKGTWSDYYVKSHHIKSAVISQPFCEQHWSVQYNTVIPCCLLNCKSRCGLTIHEFFIIEKEMQFAFPCLRSLYPSTFSVGTSFTISCLFYLCHAWPWGWVKLLEVLTIGLDFDDSLTLNFLLELEEIQWFGNTGCCKGLDVEQRNRRGDDAEVFHFEDGAGLLGLKPLAWYGASLFCIYRGRVFEWYHRRNS